MSHSCSVGPDVNHSGQLQILHVRDVRQRVEDLTDDLAAKPYERLDGDELAELEAALAPLAELLIAELATV